MARVELGTESYEAMGLYNGKPAAGMALRLAAGANALDTANCVKAKMEELARYFPPGMKVDLPLRHHPLCQGVH